MKKIIFFFLLTLLVFTGIGTAPHLLKIDRVRDGLAERLGTQLGIPVSTEQIQWHWLPMPHLSLQNATIINDNIAISMPEILVHPHWRSFFSEEFILEKIILNRPRIAVKSTDFKFGKANFPLLQTKVIVKNGQVLIENGLDLPNISFSEPLLFLINRAEAAISANRLHFEAQGHSSIARQFTVLGKLDIEQQTYLSRIDCQGLQLHKATAIAQGRIVPVEQEVNLTAFVEGTGLDTISARILGEVPCFVAKPSDKQLLLNCGFTDLTLEKDKDVFSLRINRFELKEPGLILSGNIERRVAKSGDQPLWHIDLLAGEINLSQVREGVLTLWGDNRITQTVTNIVQGGSARTVFFQLDGPAAAFRSLEAMTIGADVISAPISVPFVEMSLTEAQGPVLIKDGILSGNNLSASYGKSRGKNCSILLGLTGENRPFQLDLDIDADLAALPEILHRVVNHAGFQQELARFSKVSGSGNAHLSIGDTLKDPKVHVTADHIKATTQYNRLSWTVAVTTGSFKLMPGKVSWQQVQGAVGPHTVDGAAGVVSWGKEQPAHLIVDLPAAIFDSAAVFSELAANNGLPAHMTANITAVHGTVDVQNGHIVGPFLTPQNWTYRFNAHTKKTQWDGPDLTGPATLENATLFISNSKLTLSDSRAVFSGQPFEVSGTFTHALLDNWQGQLKVAGTLNRQLSDWLRQKQWIPSTYFPRIPCTLKDFNIIWHDTPTKIAGTVIAGLGGQQAPSANVTLTPYGKTLTLQEITFQDQNRKGRLAIQLNNSLPDRLQLTWQGELRAETVDALFENNILTNGVLKGNFQLDTAIAPGVPFMDGNLEAENLSWPWPGNTKMPAVLNFRIQGGNKHIDVKELRLALDASALSLTGQASRSANGLAVNLDLAAPAASRTHLKTFLVDLKNKAKKLVAHRPALLTDDGAFSGWDMTGTIHFDIEKFFIKPRVATDDKDQQLMQVLTPFRGRLELTAGPTWHTMITNSRLCGIDLTGTLNSDTVHNENIFDLAAAHTLLFQNLLPCLGIEQDLIEGTFSLHGSLHGEPGNWTTGNLDIISSKGRILRMMLLSRIFSLVNITDLFSTPDTSSESPKGFSYSDLELKTVIRDNRLIITKCVIRGEGLNLFAKGQMGLDTFDTDITVLIAPFKTLDAIVGNMPLVGRAVGGKNTALVTIPVGVKGNIADPEVTLLPAQAVGEGIVTLVEETLKLPFSIFSPPPPQDEPPPAPAEQQQQ
jgi:hypothetical protein